MNWLPDFYHLAIGTLSFEYADDHDIREDGEQLMQCWLTAVKQSECVYAS